MFTCFSSSIFSSSIFLTTCFTIAIVITGEWIRREILGLECSCDRCLTSFSDIGDSDRSE